MNDTESRALLMLARSIRAPRTATTDEVVALMDSQEFPQTHQGYIRKRTQAYIQRNWEFVRELVPCDGDCASPSNPCSDVQATACYNDNIVSIENQ